MPSVKQRKNSQSARKRFEEKYIDVDDHSHPYKLYPPNKVDTDKFRKLMNTRNYVRIMTQLDKNLYVLQQYYIYTEPDIWICGDAIVLNQNPDKKIMVKPMCTSRKDTCLCYHEDEKEFLSICPDCRMLNIYIKDSPHLCKHCGFEISVEKINDMPFARIPCSMCPREIGWDRAQNIRELVFDSLQARSHMIEMKQNDELDNMFEELSGGK